MLRGIEATKAGMMSVLEYNDNLAHSLANSNTIGFKQSQISFRDIHESLINSRVTNDLDKPTELGSLSSGCCVDNYYIDFSQGPIKETGRALDFAINGDGFFKLQMNDGSTTYTRNGVLQVQTDGTITDNFGNKLMNRNGVVKINMQDNQNASTIDVQKLSVRSDGEIYYGNEIYGRIDLYDFADKTKLIDKGEGRYVSTDENANPAKLVKNVNIQQFALEMSNANSILTMINSLNAHRAYESMNNVMQSNSKSLEQAISRVGKAVG